jgi:hypothetical protein
VRLPGPGTLTLLAFAFCCAIALGLFFVTEDASAAYSYSCSTPPGSPSPEEITDDAIETRNQRIEDAANCAALAERLETVYGGIASLDERLAALDDAAPGTAAQRVALAAADRQRLDLMWWGMWGLVGLTLVLLFSSKWHSAWRFLRE